MTRGHDVEVSLQGLTVTNAHDGSSQDLGQLRGVHILILMRHRH